MEIIEKTFETNGSMNTREKTERIILHHADSSNCTVEDIDRWHKNNGWCKIGYHFFINKKGEIYRGREENAVGAHAYGSNYNSIGICFEGKYMEEEMPAEQIRAGQELVAYLKNKYSITTVQAHRDVCRTSCPGLNFKFDEIAQYTAENSAENAEQQVNTAEKENVVEGNVATIQTELNSRYGLKIKVDNIAGNETKGALTYALQKELGVTADKIFGPVTKAHCPNIRKGANSNIVWLIQASLVCHGFDIDVDGIWGANTDNAVREFQRRNNLAVDSICGKNTFYCLFR